MKKFTIAFMLSLLICTGANAQVKDTAYKDWTVYIMTSQGKRTCYITSFPKAKSGNFKKRDAPYFMVTYLGNDVSEVSTSSGYKYKEGSSVSVEIDDKKLTMFTGGEIAWAKDKVTDNEFITAMKKQNSLRVKGTSSKGSYSVDKYSLNGFSDAYDRMKDSCSK